MVFVMNWHGIGCSEPRRHSKEIQKPSQVSTQTSFTFFYFISRSVEVTYISLFCSLITIKVGLYKFFQKSRNRLKILSENRMKCKKLCTEVFINIMLHRINLVARATCRPDLCISVLKTHNVSKRGATSIISVKVGFIQCGQKKCYVAKSALLHP